MRKMTSRLVLVALTLVPTGGRAQSPAAGHAAPRDAMATEVALLRQTVERLAAVAVKSQVLAARLAVQQQQVIRQQEAMARAEDAIEAARQRQEHTRASLDRLNRSLANIVEDPRAEARREVENLTAELQDQDRELARLRTRLSSAEQSLRNQQQSYAELDTALGRLVSEAERPRP